MTQKSVQTIIGQILTDEELRSDFLERPMDTLASLCDLGFELTKGEVEALAKTDPRLWRLGAKWVDGRLQRVRLNYGARDGRDPRGTVTSTTMDEP
jgi:hypothetical protein